MRQRETGRTGSEQGEQIVVERTCSWHPQYFGTALVMGTLRVSATLGSFGSHGVCTACQHAIRIETGLAK